MAAYMKGKTRLLLLDYDGVLAPIVERPEQAAPTAEVRALLARLTARPGTRLVVVSGRDRETLEQWLGDISVDMSAEHGHFIKENDHWQSRAALDMSWRADVRQAMQELVEKYPGSHIEPKQASLVWHYRQVESGIDIPAALQRVQTAAAQRAEVMPGKCVIDVRAKGADKGSAVRHWYDAGHWDFVMCIGDDITDEAMFAALPGTAWTIKVGERQTGASMRLDHQAAVIDLLGALAKTTQTHDV